MKFFKSYIIGMSLIAVALLTGCAALGWERQTVDPTTGLTVTEFDPAAAQATVLAAQSAMKDAGMDGNILYALLGAGGLALGYWARKKQAEKTTKTEPPKNLG